MFYETNMRSVSEGPLIGFDEALAVYQQQGWTIALAYEPNPHLTAYPCAQCGQPVIMDYLCGQCRE